MTDRTRQRWGRLLALVPVTWAASLSAQTVPTPQETPRTIPGLVITTPTPVPTRTPVPVPTDAVRGLTLPTTPPTPRVAATPRPRVTRKPTPDRTPAVATPTEAPSPSPTATPAVTPVAPQPVVTAVPSPDVTPTSTPSAMPAPTAEGSGSWPWIVAALAALLAVAVWWVIRRRGRSAPDEATSAPIPAVAATAAPVAPLASPIPTQTAPTNLSIALQPGRAGLNMLSAVVEAHVLVANPGDEAVHDVRVFATLLSAHSGQDADLAAAFAAPSGRPANPPFALGPGEERRVRIVAVLPRGALRSMEAAGRPMFVPLLAVDVRYTAAAGTQAQVGQAFIIGIERVDSAKLAPFWLDAPLRMHDQIAARPQGAAVVG